MVFREWARRRQRRRADGEFAALGDAGAVVAAGVDAVAAGIVEITLPGDDEIAVGIHGDGRQKLRAGSMDVDVNFGALGSAGGIEALGIDAGIVEAFLGTL